MLQSKTPLPQAMDYDLRKTVGENRLHSMWLIMTGYRTIYSVAALCTGFAALANTGTFLLLRYFIDNWLGVETPAVSLWGILAGFMGLALLQAFFTFTARRLDILRSLKEGDHMIS